MSDNAENLTRAADVRTVSEDVMTVIERHKAKPAAVTLAGTALVLALGPFLDEDASCAIIGVAAVLGALIAATENPTLSYSRATQTILGIMTGKLLD